MNMGFHRKRQKYGKLSVVSEHIRFVRIFVAFIAEGATNRSGAAKIGKFSH